MSISPPRPAGPDRSQDQILAAVLDDVRNTLRVGWIDPALRTLAFEPAFLAAAWAATRPNVTRSFAAAAASVSGARKGLVSRAVWKASAAASTRAAGERSGPRAPR